jgi:hypothetical protein
MTGSVLTRIDALVGNGIEAAVKAKHRHRLRKLGWERALEPDSDGNGLWALSPTRLRGRDASFRC